MVIVSTEGPFKAVVSKQSGISSEFAPETSLRAPSQEHRVEALRVSSGESSSGSGRLVTISATGIANNDYVRSGAYVIRVPFSRMNQALQRVNRLGGRVTNVVVS